jgi:hypothetical protein
VEPETKQAIAETAKKTERVAEETVRKPWVQSFARMGFYAKGFLFVIIGLSAIMLASGLRGGRISDPIGAMSALGQFTWGKVLLILLAIGALGHGLWNILKGVADVDDTGKGIKGIIARSASVGIGIFYFILAFIAAQTVFTDSPSPENGQGEQTITWVFLSIPLGAIVVLLIGLGFFGAAVHECYSGVSGNFQNNYKTWKLSPGTEKFISVLGIVSFVTRAVLYVLVGYFFFLAANLNDPAQAEGMDGALLALAQSKFGGILLFASGFGLVCHGVLAFFEAKYRRIC